MGAKLFFSSNKYEHVRLLENWVTCIYSYIHVQCLFYKFHLHKLKTLRSLIIIIYQLAFLICHGNYFLIYQFTPNLLHLGKSKMDG